MELLTRYATKPPDWVDGTRCRVVDQHWFPDIVTMRYLWGLLLHHGDCRSCSLPTLPHSALPAMFSPSKLFCFLFDCPSATRISVERACQTRPLRLCELQAPVGSILPSKSSNFQQVQVMCPGNAYTCIAVFIHLFALFCYCCSLKVVRACFCSR